MDTTTLTERIRKKSAALLDRIVPGITHADKTPGSRPEWVELSFPGGLTCVTSGNPLEAEYMYREIFENRVYTAFAPPLAHDAIVIDAGANCGLFSMYLLGSLEKPTVYAFEPVPAVYDTLVKNVAPFGNKGIKPQNQALGSRTGTAEMAYYPHLPGNSTFYPETKKRQRGLLALAFGRKELAVIREERRISVERTTLSAFIGEHGISRIDLLKIDTEGSEEDILDGIRDEDWPKITRVSIEVHQARKNLPKIAARLEGRGFMVREVAESRDPLGSVNVIALRP